MSRRRATSVAVCLALLLAAAGWPREAAQADAGAVPRLVIITIPDRHGHIPSKWLSYPGEPRAAVLLPAHYDPQRRYPLILNLGGLGGNYQQAAFGPGLRVDAIVVTPEPGSGWYVDWWNNGRRGAPAWETYYLDDVLPTILHRYPIRPERRYHAVIGISMGGLGATYLGGRLPGFFGTVASLSGFLNPQYYSAVTHEAMGLVSFAPVHGDYNLYPVYGPPKGFYAAGHNPTRLVANLEHTRVFATTGTGLPSAAARTDPSAVPSGSLEGGIIRPMNDAFHRAAVAAGVDHTYRVQPGGHNNTDFSQELAAMFAWGLFKPVVTAPRSWVNDTVASHGQLWDIHYRFDAAPSAIVRFHRFGNTFEVSDAGARVRIRTTGGCVVHTRTPATIRLPADHC